MKDFKKLIALCIFCLIHVLAVAAPEDWMPDPNLRNAISETLEIETFTIEDIQMLHKLDIYGKSNIESLSGLDHATHTEHGGLRFDRSPFGGFVRSGGGPWHISDIKQFREDLLHESPNTLFFAEVRYFDGHHFRFTEDSPYWLRKPDGSIARTIFFVDDEGMEYWEQLVDYTHPDVIEMIVAQAVAVANCGLYDGIILDN